MSFVLSALQVHVPENLDITAVRRKRLSQNLRSTEVLPVGYEPLEDFDPPHSFKQVNPSPYTSSLLPGFSSSQGYRGVANLARKGRFDFGLQPFGSNNAIRVSIDCSSSQLPAPMPMISKGARATLGNPDVTLLGMWSQQRADSF